MLDSMGSVWYPRVRTTTVWQIATLFAAREYHASPAAASSGVKTSISPSCAGADLQHTTTSATSGGGAPAGHSISLNSSGWRCGRHVQSAHLKMSYPVTNPRGPLPFVHILPRARERAVNAGRCGGIYVTSGP
jgi:hypothetical protein